MALIYVRRDTTANWLKAGNPVLQPGEGGLNTDTGEIFFGDGVTQYTGLPKTQIAPGGKSFALVDDETNLLEAAVMAALGDALGQGSGGVDGNSPSKVARVLAPFVTALANAANAPVDVMVSGTSLSEGEKASALGLRWTDRLLAALRAKAQPSAVRGGVGYIPVFYVTTAIASPWTLSVTGRRPANFGWGHRFTYLTPGDTATLAFTGTDLDLIYTSTPDSASCTVSIDGGAPVTLDLSGSIVHGLKKSAARGLADGPHTAVFTGVVGSSNIEGAMVYRGDLNAGVRLWEGAHAGWQASQLTDFALLNRVQPQLVVIELMTNDVRGAIPLASYRASILQRIADVRANTTRDPAIVLVAAYPESTKVTETEPYRQALRDIAAADDGVLLFDLAPRFGDVTVDAANLVFDTVHYTDAGAELWGSTFSEFVTPGVAPMRAATSAGVSLSAVRYRGTVARGKAVSGSFEAVATMTEAQAPALPYASLWHVAATVVVECPPNSDASRVQLQVIDIGDGSESLTVMHTFPPAATWQAATLTVTYTVPVAANQVRRPQVTFRRDAGTAAIATPGAAGYGLFEVLAVRA
jgi:hypothetical protein